MTARQLLRTLEVRKVELTIGPDGQLVTHTPAACTYEQRTGRPCHCDPITPALAERIQRHHDELVALIRQGAHR